VVPSDLRDLWHAGVMHLAAIVSSAGGLDEILFHAINLAGTNPVLDALMIFITTIGGTFVVALFAFLLWGQNQREAAADFVLLFLLTEIVTTSVKILVDRSRPCTIPSFANTLPGYGCEPDPAFPSGHALRTFALAAFVGLRFRWRAGGVAMVYAFLVGLSRIYLGVHWPSDILGGALLGIALAVLIEYANRRIGFYQRVRKRLVDLIPHWPSRKTA
jgi:undecaprenyl-diphosphatase